MIYHCLDSYHIVCHMLPAALPFLLICTSSTLFIVAFIHSHIHSSSISMIPSIIVPFFTKPLILHTITSLFVCNCIACFIVHIIAGVYYYSCFVQSVLLHLIIVRQLTKLIAHFWNHFQIKTYAPHDPRYVTSRNLVPDSGVADLWRKSRKTWYLLDYCRPPITAFDTRMSWWYVSVRSMWHRW